MDAKIEGFDPEMEAALAADLEKLNALMVKPQDEADADFVAGFEAAAEIAIKFAEELAPARNGGKRMREHFDAYRAKAQG
jgi:hypothetical protein